MRRLLLASIATVAALATVTSTVWASPLKVCVPKREGVAMLTPKHGKCKHGYALDTFGEEGKTGATGATGAEGKPGATGHTGPEGKPGTDAGTGLSASELETLKSVLPYIKYVASGVGGKPTIQFSAVNVQVVDGEGNTEATNGEGNLVIGYDEDTGGHEQTGSHNLILGEEQTFTSFGGILAGYADAITSPFASVTGGRYDKATGYASSVSGGYENSAEEEFSSVSGGDRNKADNIAASVSGGYQDDASGVRSAVDGGENNKATGQSSVVLGGLENVAVGKFSVVYGGKAHKVEAETGVEG